MLIQDITTATVITFVAQRNDMGSYKIQNLNYPITMPKTIWQGSIDTPKGKLISLHHGTTAGYRIAVYDTGDWRERYKVKRYNVSRDEFRTLKQLAKCTYQED